MNIVNDAELVIEAADVLVSGPSDNDQDIVLPIINVDDGIWFNGVADDAHEPFHFGPRGEEWVKTNQKPYDTAVACILLRAYLLAPKNMVVR